MKTNLPDIFKKARARAVPLIGIETADPAATVRTCIASLNGKGEQFALILWDCIQGPTGLNEKGRAWVSSIPDDIKPSMTNPAEFLAYVKNQTAETALNKAIVFYSNAARFTDNESVMQGIWNLRDTFKQTGATLTLLSPMLRLPAELTRDVAVISEPLPEAQDIEKIVDSICQDTKAGNETFTMPDDKTKPVIIDTLLGLSAFEAEQAIALSLTKDGIDTAQLWQRKVKAIEATPGLSVWQGKESFDDLGGLANLKQFLTAVLTSGKTPIRAVYFVDEVEKSLAGSAGDTSGTSQDQLQQILTYMQDKNIPGMILIGHPGTGKSAIAKAAGNVAKAPVLAMDFGAMKGSLVGQSEQRIREALTKGEAVSQGKALFIFTCNKIGNLPPEFRRRCTLGTFFVDLPDADDQPAIWRLWVTKYGLDTAQQLPACDGWTGAEIRACCDVAFRTGLNLTEASKFIVPVIKAAPDQVKALREMANGRFISASKPGVYEWPPKQTTTRKMEI
jgi:hypothetical protein